MSGAARTATARERLWLKRFAAPLPAGATKLLCFHYAGGSAGVFRHWAARLPSVEVIGVQLPGRADRFLEERHARMDPLVEELIDVLGPSLDQPFACYGSSMGARVAWALAHALRDRELPLPRALFVSASGGPALDDGNWLWEDRDDGLEGYVREMGGTPPSVLAEASLLAALLPVLEADLSVLSTHDFHPDVPLDLPIHAFAGEHDPEAGPEHMQAWRDETTAAFSMEVLPCGHFFDSASEAKVIDSIGRTLDGPPARTRPSAPSEGTGPRPIDEGVAI
ncbi:thioesterase II family protein [Streptomyces sp. NPDC090052]|uniref:thioesterase II family protein n=1 Tax=unclassified Streptomyces TaxID=2593676 RepID=UPI002254048E|nr:MULTISPECIES: thioesterase domain-containing protein [unclassified Streptomyces]MCX4728893.1 thioesterase domain-containing protein [Streptomyces sp. NBC_01306]WSV08300.1 thioesterase domain-containing protein [Streptomyces sp. NBC_01020]WSX46388.1 thioesterase domain-containing protein [Streptomyces sp. NBC_00963]WSX65543.1 thioesterase domain-containing protein [Streptomyces sp. NBC_00932]